MPHKTIPSHVCPVRHVCPVCPARHVCPACPVRHACPACPVRHKCPVRPVCPVCPVRRPVCPKKTPRRPCKILCKPVCKPLCKPKCPCDNVAFGLVHVSESNASLDNNTSNKNIKSVERLGVGRYKITWKIGTFSRKPDKRAPVINVTPCESGVLQQVMGTDSDGNPIILSEFFPSEQAVVLCQHVDNKSAIVITGRVIIPSDSPPVNLPPIIGPPQVTGDVDFYIHAIQANC